MNWKKLYRIYREERLTVRKRGGRKQALGTRAPMAIPQGPNLRPLSADSASPNRLSGKWISGLRVRLPGLGPPVPRAVNHRRLKPGVPGRRRRHIDLGPSCCAGTGPDRRAAGLSLHGGQRQRDGTDFECDPDVATGPEGRMALHRAWQTHAERLRRELQRPPAGRVPQRAPVLQPFSIGLGPMAHRSTTMPVT